MKMYKLILAIVIGLAAYQSCQAQLDGVWGDLFDDAWDTLIENPEGIWHQFDDLPGVPAELKPNVGVTDLGCKLNDPLTDPEIDPNLTVIVNSPNATIVYLWYRCNEVVTALPTPPATEAQIFSTTGFWWIREEPLTNVKTVRITQPWSAQTVPPAGGFPNPFPLIDVDVMVLLHWVDENGEDRIGISRHHRGTYPCLHN